MSLNPTVSIEIRGYYPMIAEVSRMSLLPREPEPSRFPAAYPRWGRKQHHRSIGRAGAASVQTRLRTPPLRPERESNQTPPSRSADAVRTRSSPDTADYHKYC